MHVESVTSRLHFVRTEHVNWVIYSGPDGVVLIDSGYLGQRRLLEASLSAVGRTPADVHAVLLTHGHADHLGGASWLAGEYGVPVFAGDHEVAHVRRDRIEQVGKLDVLRNAYRPGVLGWAIDILPLLGGQPELGVPSASSLPISRGVIDVPGSPIARMLPGHTSGNMIFHFPHEGAVIVGDALVTGHRTSRRQGPQMLPSMFHHDESTARKSLTLMTDVDAALLLPGHGPRWTGSPSDAVDQALGAESHRKSPGPSRRTTRA